MLCLWDPSLPLLAPHCVAGGFVCSRPRRTSLPRETDILWSRLLTSQTKQNILTSTVTLAYDVKAGTHTIIWCSGCCSISGFSLISSCLLHSFTHSFICWTSIYWCSLLCACHPLLQMRNLQRSYPQKSYVLKEKPVKKSINKYMTW